MLTLHLGSVGAGVQQLQAQLNARFAPLSCLAVDGVFGPETYQAVMRFQSGNWLVADGEVGPCTWNALMQTESYSPVLHSIPLIPQPTATTCWAASTAMVSRSSVPSVIARTPADLVLADGSLRNWSETNDPMTGARKFARANGLMVLPPASWMPAFLRDRLQRGPLMFDMLWRANEYTRGHGSSGHMIVVVGIRGDADQSGRGTTLRIQDPWAPNVGKTYSVSYHKWIQEVPTRTYHTYQRI